MNCITIILLFLSFVALCPAGIAQNYRPESDGEIVEHTYYTLSYSEEDEQAEWVYYVLTPEMVSGSAKRTDNFREDSKISSGSAVLKDYVGSGYDRGHLAPAASMSINHTAMSESFYLSNMSPQKPSFNRGAWKNLETVVRNWALKYDKIYVVTGPILDNPIGTIGVNEVTVPRAYYKVVYVPNEKMIALVMPNEKIDKPLYYYAVEVDEVESITGVDFFVSLNDEQEDKFESSINVSDWHFDTYNNVSKSKNNPIAVKVRCKGCAKSTGVRCKTTTTNPNGYCHHHQNQIGKIDMSK